MTITINSLAAAINEKKHIFYLVQYVNNYGHIVHEMPIMENKTIEQVKRQAKKEKFMYPECYIEILDIINKKRVYA